MTDDGKVSGGVGARPLGVPERDDDAVAAKMLSPARDGGREVGREAGVEPVCGDGGGRGGGTAPAAALALPARRRRSRRRRRTRRRRG